MVGVWSKFFLAIGPVKEYPKLVSKFGGSPNKFVLGQSYSPGPSVCLSVCKVYCGKTADWIRMPFGVVSGVGRGTGVLDGGGDRRRGRGSFGGEFWASHCNQWGFCCIVVREQRALLKLL